MPSPAEICSHLGEIRQVKPSGHGCKECLEMGDTWVHLRECLSCGHIGCCDSSKNKHATKHFHQTKHPISAIFRAGRRLALVLRGRGVSGVTSDFRPRASDLGPLPSAVGFVGLRQVRHFNRASLNIYINIQGAQVRRLRSDVRLSYLGHLLPNPEAI